MIENTLLDKTDMLECEDEKFTGAAFHPVMANFIPYYPANSEYQLIASAENNFAESTHTFKLFLYNK